ncbi:protein patched homolog 1-like [Saccostrea echinata]|uniref:protein patched homolog 1-like n=1 Tax=Saccostrea echinata TaxID=191078 RepID=UPI002A83D7BF|nr:protein patched homolog 1-like [Saccostrea echinata]
MRSRKKPEKEVDEELVTRTSWVNAELAYKHVKKGKADGSACALWLRMHIQRYMFKIGGFIQLHCGKVLFVGILLLSLCCIGLKTTTLQTDVEKLWVEEGGRLEKELEYTRTTVGEGRGTTSQLVIQTPRGDSNILTVPSFQFHLETLLKVTQISVDMFDVTWKFHDLCYLPEFPKTEGSGVWFANRIEEITPCLIITPLDCFWDGAKILGPDHNVYVDIGLPIKWTNLDPLGFVKAYRQQDPSNSYLRDLEEIMNKSGISRGYLDKPCLDPYESECPRSAPNKAARAVPDIGATLTGGCSGISTKYMHWSEDLIVGGVRKNRTGHIVRGEALQSIIQLMAEQEMYQYWSEHWKTHSIGWSLEKARAILQAWQRKFTEVVNNAQNGTKGDEIYGFSSVSLADIMKEFSSLSPTRVALGYVLMVFYACISLMRWNNGVQSQSGVGVAGVLLVALSVAAGLGVCAVLGISFNAATTQIIPFLALGLGVDDIFLMAHTYGENSANKHIAFNDQTAECLKRTGVSVFLTSVTNMLAFLSASIIPIPALRAFSLQASILIFFNLFSVLLIYPAICSIDLYRKDDRRIDIFCCFQSFADTKDTVIELQPKQGDLYDLKEPSPPPSYNDSLPPSYSSVVKHNTVARSAEEGGSAVTSLARPSIIDLPPSVGMFSCRPRSLSAVCPSTTSSRQCLTAPENISCAERFARFQRHLLNSSLDTFARNVYGPFIKKAYVKVFSILGFIILLCVSVYGIVHVKNGLDLTEIVPKHTPEYNFLTAQSKYFGFFNIYLVTKSGVDYPNNQRLLTQYHRSFQTVDKIIKREDGSLPNFWLDLFKQWLQDLQRSFDTEYAEGRVTQQDWKANASDSAILAYKLLIQTGDVDNPIDKSRIPNTKLVDSEGIISPDAFYNYLTAWVSNDAMAYASSQANFHPEPKIWLHDAKDRDFKVPKAQPLTYTQLAFYLSDQTSTEVILDTIKAVRDICDTYTDRGLPNYPSGTPFTFWEQYINLRFYLSLSLLCVLVVTFLVLTLVLVNPWLASIVVVVLGLIVVELFGFMGLSDIRLSAVPAVILIVSVGIGVEFTVHISVGFLTAIGSRNKRMTMSLEHMFAPVVHGAISTLLGIVMLVGAEFQFVVKYFFNVLAALIVIGLINGLLFLPILLSLFGPKAEIRPKNDEDRIPTPSPEPSPKPKKKSSSSSSRSRGNGRHFRIPSDLSLTTITEEPTQYSSHEIVVEPEVVVETTTVPTKQSDSVPSSGENSRCSTPPPTVVTSTPQTHHVTRVKATATVKVEVHTPIPGSVESVNHDHVYKSKRRKNKETENQESDSSSKS